MKRVCDGTDNLLIGEDGKSPCECGLEFDDVKRMVVWPHTPVGKPLTEKDIEKLTRLMRDLGMT